jgi:hypothetical protein
MTKKQFATPDDFLAHHGVKGQKWGVIRDRDGSSGGNSAKAKTSSAKSKSDVNDLVAKVGKQPAKAKISDHEKAVLKKMNLSEKDADQMQLKYGPGSMKERKHLTPAQRNGLIIAGVGVLGVGLLAAGTYYNYKKMLDIMNGNGPDPFKVMVEKVTKDRAYNENFKAFWKTSFEKSREGLVNMSNADVEKMSKTPLSFKAGSIFKRVSSEAEDEIRSNGFYAAFKDADVERYKAAMPVYWKINNLPAKRGFVVSLKATAAIKAPSPREGFDIWEKLLKENPVVLPDIFDEGDGSGGLRLVESMGGHISDLSTPEGVRSLALKSYKQMAAGWANDFSPLNEHYFEKVRKAGYNALIDANDEGAISETPMRFLDGSLFTIAGHEPLTPSQIKQAQDNVLALAHAIYEASINFMEQLGLLKTKKGGD